MVDMKWETKDGQILDIKDMETTHIINCINYCKKKNEKGVEIIVGHDIEDFDYEIDFHYFDIEIEEFEKELLKRNNYEHTKTSIHLNTRQRKRHANTD